jgi:RNA polymerase sigma-70 factor (family 1)
MRAYSKLTDQQLTALLIKGDEQSFTEIYRRYAAKLAGFASSKLYNFDDAKDILHDMFVNLWENREQIHITTNLQSYLFGVIRHRIIDKIRKNITREQYALMVQALTASFEESSDRQLEAKELKQIVEQSLDELSPRVREIYRMSRESGLRNREIAEKLNLSEQTVKNQLSMAIKHLRKSVTAIGVLTTLLGFLW